MKVLDLTCEHAHRFEGWFQSAQDFESQLEKQLVECPICASKTVQRVPSAPRLNLSGATAPAQRDGASGAGEQPMKVGELQAQWLQMMRQVIEHTEDVGEQFAEEARRIHYDEAPARSIRGVTTPDDARALLDEGIDVMPLPLPTLLKKPLQ
ncbi:DUF1178 family protein [Mycetohabitans sp. B46]|uniref:DUF1178 family protein n=1 Tax=Mycetohabitans sp. B46 TaxID=2772536 RepID=UPI00307CCBBD